MAKPLFQLTSETKINKTSNRRERKHLNVYRKLTDVDWTPECDQSLQDLRDALLNNVILSHPDFSKPFVLSTDASSDGLGAILSQVASGDGPIQ